MTDRRSRPGTLLLASVATLGCAALLAEQGHGPGPHGGTVADWSGNYHVEFAVDHARQEATVYVLGSDGKTNAPVKMQKLLLAVADPVFEVELWAAPLDGEPAGTSSRFVGKHENLGRQQEFAGIITGKADRLYTGDFKEQPEGHHPH